MCADVRPFKPFVFEKDNVHCLSPPFDTISKEEERTLKNHPYNITHLTLPDGKSEDVMNSKFRNWLRDEILLQEETDSLMVIKQDFNFGGESFTRYGLIGLVRINPNDGSIKPHEKTFESSVMGRVDIMSKLRSQLEPIFLTADSQGLTPLLKEALEGNDPFVAHTDSDGTVTEVFRIGQTEKMHDIREALSTNSLLVADGHHRLEATRRLSQISPDEDKNFWSYVMAYITPLNEEGLIIAGIHRVLKKNIKLSECKEEAGRYFDLKKIENLKDTTNMIAYDGEYHELIPKEAEIRKAMEINNDEPLVTADVLNRILFSKVLKLTEDDLEFKISYLHDAGLATREIDEDRAGITLIMPRWDKNEFFQVIADGKFLPQKSTYFYPKVPSGIAIHSNFKP